MGNLFFRELQAGIYFDGQFSCFGVLLIGEFVENFLIHMVFLSVFILAQSTMESPLFY